MTDKEAYDSIQSQSDPRRFSSQIKQTDYTVLIFVFELALCEHNLIVAISRQIIEPIQVYVAQIAIGIAIKQAFALPNDTSKVESDSTLACMIVVTHCQILSQKLVRSVLHDMLHFASVNILLRVETCGHQLLPNCLIVSPDS